MKIIKLSIYIVIAMLVCLLIINLLSPYLGIITFPLASLVIILLPQLVAKIALKKNTILNIKEKIGISALSTGILTAIALIMVSVTGKTFQSEEDVKYALIITLFICIYISLATMPKKTHNKTVKQTD